MKKFLTLFMVLTLAFSFSLGLVGCKEKQPTGGMSKQEVAQTYKQVAKGVWTLLGVSDPTQSSTGAVTGASLMSIEIPDLTTETTGESSFELAKYNLAGTNLYINFIGDLYSNENFVLTDKLVTFNAGGDMDGFNYNSTFTMYNKIDMANNNIYVELGISDPQVNNYTYLIFDIGYDFTQKIATSYRMIYYEPGYIFNDQIYTAEGKFYISDSNELPLYQESLDAYVSKFETKKQEAVVLTARFDEEFQRMSDLASKIR